MSDNALLPPNSTLAEIGMAGAVARVSAVDVPNRHLYNPALCPSALLPWLAWAFSLDEWNPLWTEGQKRQAIADSVFIHRHKGTLGALDRALSSLGYDLTIKEWHRLTPQGDPYTFGLQLEIHDIGIADASEFDRIVDVANSAKNVRSKMKFINMISTRDCPIYSGGVVYCGETVSISAEA